MRRHVISYVTLALALQYPAMSSAETLAEAIALAYRNNPTLESSRYDVQAADEGVAQARSELRLTSDLQVTGSYNRTVEGRASRRANPFGPQAFDQNSNQAQIAIVQPLYTGGRATADEAAAAAGVRASREALRGVEGDLILAIITAYVDVRRYEASLKVLDASVTELEKLTDEISARQEAGELTRTDIAQAQSQLEIAREQATLTEQNLEASRSDYAALVGQNAGALAEEPPLPQLPGNVTNAYDLAERQNPELAQARYTELQSRGEIASARAQGRPTLSLRGTATLSGEAIPYHLRDQDQGFAGSLVFTLPLSAGGHTASLIRQAGDRNSSDRLRIEGARRTLMRDVSSAWNAVVTAGRSSRLLEAQHKAALIQLEGMIAEYRVGLRSTFDVLYAQQSLRDAEVSLLGSKRDLYVAEATLLRRTGLLEARAIMAGVALYDPATHLRHVEHSNALPWDGAIAAIDSVAAPAAHQRRIDQPGLSGETPTLIAPRSAANVDGDLSRTVPTAPIPGTAAQSSPLHTGQH